MRFNIFKVALSFKVSSNLHESLPVSFKFDCLQARIVAINASYFLKNGGHFVISIKANCIDSTAEPEAVFAGEVKKMQAEKMKPQEQVLYRRESSLLCISGQNCKISLGDL
jgi:hypothetical protein